MRQNEKLVIREAIEELYKELGYYAELDKSSENEKTIDKTCAMIDSLRKICIALDVSYDDVSFLEEGKQLAKETWTKKGAC